MAWKINGDYFLFKKAFVAIAMKIKKWYSCNIFISFENQYINISYEIMTPNCHQHLDFIVLEKWQGNIPIGLSTTLSGFKSQQLYGITKLSPKTWDIPPKKGREINQWAFVPLGTYLIYPTEPILQTYTPTCN